MARHVRLAELWAGIEGAALFRHILDCDDDFAARRLQGLRHQLAALDDPNALGGPVPELDVDAGYEAWASGYDDLDNALITAEQPIVEQALDGIAPGRALDAACGTGRHTARLVAHGHSTVGVDRSEAMIAVARQKVTEADFRTGDLNALPLDDGSFDVAVCSLALTHLPELTAPLSELARVVRPGGRIVISDAHPTFVALQGQAVFPTGRGRLAYIRNEVHLHSAYLTAFAAGGLTVKRCAEAPWNMDFRKGLFAGAAEAASSFWSGLPIVLVWELSR